MPITREPITVRVRDHTLHVGDARLPLHTVTRATTTELEHDHKVAVLIYALTVTKWLIPAAIAAAVTPEAISALINLGALVWFTTSTVQLVRLLRLRLHELTVATMTGAHRVLVGTDAGALAEVAFRITDAIRDPALEFHLRAENVRLTDAAPQSPQENPTWHSNLG